MSDFPYPGLRPFKREEADIFFGREEQTDQLLEKLGHNRFIAVVGLSGCGKSSLVRAGMIAALESGYLASAGAYWRIAEMRPGDRPIQNLAEALLAVSALGPELSATPGEETRADAAQLPFLLASLRSSHLGLVEVVRDLRLPQRTNVLLLVDQFEELFRYHREGGRDETEAFVALLLASAKQTEVPIYVVLTMRSDFIGDCALFFGLPEMINAGQFLTPRLTREQQRDAIVGPARVFGGDVEPRLVNRLLNEMKNDPDQLPVLQHALMRIWTMKTFEVLETSEVYLTLPDHEAIGELKHALSYHAEEAFEELDEKQQRIAEHLFRCLSERGPDLRDTRRPVKVNEVAFVAEVSASEVIDVVEIFRRPDRSFITPSVDVTLDSDSVLDISHESLIRQWNRLNKWVAREAESAQTYQRLEQTAQLWKQGKEDLLSRLALENAKAWKKRENPTLEWAKRYSVLPTPDPSQEGNWGFNLVMEFLETSAQAQEDQRRAEEEQRRRELEAAQKLAEEAKARQVAEEKARHDAEALAAAQARAKRLVLLLGAMFLLFLLVLGAVLFELQGAKLDYKSAEVQILTNKYAEVQTLAQLVGEAVIVYPDCDYGGKAVALQPGRYNREQLRERGVENETLSSIRVLSGYRVEIYKDNNFQGRKWEFTADNPCFGQELNDKASSIVVITSVDTRLITYGKSYHLKNMYAPGSYLDTCGGATCALGTRYNVVTNVMQDRSGEGTSEWELISAKGKKNGDPVQIGDVLYLKNMYGDGSYLDVCGHATCAEDTRYSVVTHSSRDRSKGSTEWELVSAEGKKDGDHVQIGDVLYLKNMYDEGRSYLDTCGGAACVAGTLYNVVTNGGQDRSGKGTTEWSFEN